MGIKVTGKVIAGKQLGRKLGFPTANIVPEAETAVEEGVYAAKVYFEGHTYKGMANVGRKPALFGATPRLAEVNEKSQPSAQYPADKDSLTIEVNLFGFSGDLYGKTLTVELLEHIRGERKFSTSQELKAAVDNDRHTIMEYFKKQR